ncbi:MAG: DNA gyrase inhibitor YacG [Hyphomicrobiaceae bacterium]
MAANDDKPRGSCPICQKPTELKWRPFCSNRCANIDLSRWLTGGYAIPVTDGDDDEDGEGIGADVARLLGQDGDGT